MHIPSLSPIPDVAAGADAVSAFIDWPRYGLIPCEVLETFDAAPMIRAARVRVTKTHGPCVAGEVLTFNRLAIKTAAVPEKELAQ